jgi:hypothetical protein
LMKCSCRNTSLVLHTYFSSAQQFVIAFET